MGLFGRKKKNEKIEGFLGVDIGTSGIKMVELATERSRLSLRRWGYSEATSKENGKHLLDEPAKTAKLLRDVLAKTETRSTKAIASLPSSKVFHSMLSLPIPKDPDEDLKAIIENQARKFLPLPLEEMILDSNILDKDLLPKKLQDSKSQKTDFKKVQEVQDVKEADNSRETTHDTRSEKEKKYIRVLITGAPKELVAKYLDIFSQAKLELISLETEILALVRALVGKDPSRIMIVDMGAERTNLVIVQHGVPYLTRGIKSGGSAITQVLAQSMGVSFAEAEAMKRDLSYKEETTLPAPLEAALKPILHEISYALQLYADQEFHEHSSVEKVIITGGSSHVPGIVPYLTAALNVNVYLGDPWARVATLLEERLILDEVGPRLAVAVGLAMRGKEINKV